MDIAPQCVEGRLSVRANPSTPETKAPRTSFGGRSPLASTSRSQPNSSPITSRAATQGISPAELGHGTGLALSTQPVARGALAPRRGMYVAERENTRVAFHAGLSSAMGDCHVSPAGEILGERGTGRESVYRSIASEDFSGWSLEDHPPSVALTQPSTAMQWGNVSPRVDGCLPSSTNSAVAQNQDIIRAPHLWTRVASVGSTMSVPTFGSPSHERISTQLLQEGERGSGARSSGDRAPSTLSSSPSVLLSLQRDLNATIQLASELLPIHAQGCDANHQDMVSLSDRAAGDEQILRELIRMRQQFSTEATLIAEAESYYDRLDAVERQLAGTLVEIDATASTVDEIPGGTQRFTADFDLCAMLVSRLEQLEDDLEPIEDLHDRMLQSALVNREVDSNLPRLAASSQCAESELVIGALRTVEAAAARLATELSHRRASIRDALLREVRFLASQESKAEASVQAYIAEHDRQRLLDATDLRRPRQHFYYFGSERDGESSGGLTMSLAPPLLVVNDGPNEHGLAEADDLTSEGFTKGDLPSALPITVVGSSARHAQLQLCECTCQRIDAIVGRLRSLLQGRQCDLRSLDQQLRQMDAYDPSADALSSRRSQLLVAMDPLQMWQEQMRTIKTRAYAVRQSARAALETAASRRREVLHSVETVTESAAEPCTSEEMQEEDLPPPGVDALPLRAQQHSSAFSQLLRRFVGGWRTRSAALEMSNNIRFPPNMIAIPEEEEGTSCSLLTSQHVVDLEPTISRKRPREILHDASNSVSPRPSCQTRVDRSSSEASKCAESGSEDVPELIPPQRPTPSTREQAGVEKEAWVSEGDSEAVVPEEYSLRNGRLLYGIGALVKSIVRRALTFGDEEEDEPEELMSPPSVRRRVELEFAHT